MNTNIDDIVKNCQSELNQTDDINAIAALKVKYLGKSGQLTELLRGLKNLPNEQRAVVGEAVNCARTKIEELFKEKSQQAELKNIENLIKQQAVDISIPQRSDLRGTIHPITKTMQQVFDAFISLGFIVVEGPEIETDYYCFQALNIPKDHPARDMQDTFYFNENIVLRPHTSPNQIRYLEKHKPPVKMLSPGRVYRSDDDSTHSPMFHQIEGLVIDKNISIKDLKGCLEMFAKIMFGQKTQIRLRPSYFPFTEPSVEVDVTCAICHGSGCRICKNTGWIEILGAGMVNPKVLQNVGLDHNEYSGFAFGLGIERTTLIKYAIPDIKLLFENDVRFLKQFKN